MYQDDTVELDTPTGGANDDGFDLDDLDKKESRELDTIGFGLLANKGSWSNVLQEVQVDYISNIDCAEKYEDVPQRIQIKDSMLCALVEGGGQGTCQVRPRSH